VARRASKSSENQLSLTFDGRAAAIPPINIHIHIHGANALAPQQVSVELEPGTPVNETTPATPEQDNNAPHGRARPRIIFPKVARPDSLVTAPPYPERGTPEYDAHRTYLRDQLRYENRQLSRLFRKLGGQTNIQFSVFYREGMQGLYNNRDTRGLARQRFAPVGGEKPPGVDKEGKPKDVTRKIEMKDFWDFVGIAELNVNVERARRTHDALEVLAASRGTRTEAMSEHHRIGSEVRAQFRKAHAGFLSADRNGPEHLSAHAHISHIRTRIRDRARQARDEKKRAEQEARAAERVRLRQEKKAQKVTARAAPGPSGT
jgi:hypothetical protein